VKPKPKAVNKPSPHSIVHGLDKLGVFTTVSFSRHFLHAADATGLRPAVLPPFYASLLAHACHFGVEQMAHVTDLAYGH
jgi:hypothetical protein